MKYIKEVEVNKTKDSKNFNVNKIQTTMLIKIPFKTPSVNIMYGHNMRGGFYLKKEGKDIRKEIIEIVDNMEDPMFYDGDKLKVNVEIHENWYTKDGKVKKKDIANREKFLIDSVFEGLNIDDKMIFKHSMSKVQSDKEYALIKIEVLDEEVSCMSVK